MDTLITTITQAFPPLKQWVIPSYQRNYVWTEKGQWAPLWEDLMALTERVRNADPSEADAEPHFLGTVITKLNPRYKPGRLISYWWVVDGQQRLTTLQLLIAAARAAFIRHSLAKHASMLSGVLANASDFVGGPGDTYKVRHKRSKTYKESDYTVFRTIIDASLSGPSAEVSSGSPLRDCYNYFRNRADERLRSLSEDDSGDYATAFNKAILQKLVVADIQLSQRQNSHAIFEALNARGKPLTEWEKTKNYILSLAVRKDDPDGDLCYQKHLERYDADPYWRERIDLFLLYFAWLEVPRARQLISGGEPYRPERRRMSRLYREFRYVGEHLYRHDRSELEAMLARLRHYADIYRDIDEGRAAANGGFSRYALHVMGHRHVLNLSSLVPVLMILIDRIGRDEELDRVLRVVESYLMRRIALKGRYRDFDSVAFSLVQALRDADVEDIASVVLSRLLAIRGWNWWPRDDEVTGHFQTGDMYHQISSRRLKLLLAGIAERMHNQNKNTSDGSFTLGNVTIEHVAPQHWKPHWAEVFNLDESDENASRIDGLVHRIGNLTMVSYNSELSNSPWSKKKELLKKDNLELNRRLLRDIEGRDNEDQRVWNEAEIDRRSIQLAGYVNRIWPHAEVLAEKLGIELPKVSPSRKRSPAGESDDKTPLTAKQRNSRRYGKFWTHYAQRYPDDGVRAGHGHSNAWIRRGSQNPDVSLAFAMDAVGIFLTRWRRTPHGSSAWLAERQAIIDDVLGTGAERWKSFDTHNADNWDAMCDWLHEKLAVFLKIIEAQPDGSPAAGIGS